MNRRLQPDRHGGQARATFDLVAPLALQATDMPETAVSTLVGYDLRRGDVSSANQRSTPATAPTPGIRTSTTATRTTGTRTTNWPRVPSADQCHPGHADFSIEDLVVAYEHCRQHKRNTASAITFETNLEQNLVDLYERLRDGSYRPGSSTCFIITEPKLREVWAAPFADRIPHHLLYLKISPRFYRSFCVDSCACIPGRGTLYAAQRLESKVRSITQNWHKPAHYLKCDIANFFVSINKNILRGFIAAKVPEPWWMWLADTILFHDPRPGVTLKCSPDQLALVPAYKSLFNQPGHLGLPIGNLSSQFFANVYMDALDQFIKHRIGAKHYIRYVDDFILLHESPQWLNEAHDKIRWFLQQFLALRLNDSKTIRQPIERGIDFVGQVIKPYRRTLRRRTFNQALRKIETMDRSDLFESANSYFGLMRQASHSRTDRARLASLLRRRGHSVNRGLTKTYKKTGKEIL